MALAAIINIFLFFILSPLYAISLILGLSSISGFMMWVGLELNIMTMLMIMFYVDHNSPILIKYFIINATSSAMFLFAFLSPAHSSVSLLIITIAMCVKLAIAPFHWWFSHLAKKIDTFLFLMLSTTQKLLPLLILAPALSSHVLAPAFVVLGLTLPLFSMLVTQSVSNILIMSSVYNAQIMAMSMANYKIFMMFFISYGVSLCGVLIWLDLKASFNLDTTFSTIVSKNSKTLLYLTSLLSMGGIPPTLGFLGKANVAALFMSSANGVFSGMVLIISSAGVMFLYLKIILSLTPCGRSVSVWRKLPSISPMWGVTLMIISPTFLVFL